MISLRSLGRAFLPVCLSVLIPGVAVAFPPLPHHTVYGLVRDEFGNPLTEPGTELILETLAGASQSTTLVAGLESGVNYRINVPVDAGLTDDLYRPTALRPTAPFRIKVKMGGRTYVPLEMKANMGSLGQPAQSSRVDLTLGEDTDGDGLPDAWERSVIAAGKLGGSISALNPNDRLNGNSLSVLQAYIAGTYAWDPKDGFRVDIVQFEGLNPVLEFLALRGRSYSVIGSDDLVTWVPASFQVQGASTSDSSSFYQSSQLKQVRVTVPAETGKAPPKFFKLLVK